MDTKPAPENFDWVNARSKCTIQEIFKELEQGVRDDVEAAKSLIRRHDELQFSVSKASSKRFSVNRIDDPIRSLGRSVDFTWSDNVITVHNQNDELLLTASLTLNNEGRCLLKVSEQELEQWQFRRMALEKLFFGPHEPLQLVDR
jgi:hypothetical protein